MATYQFWVDLVAEKVFLRRSRLMLVLGEVLLHASSLLSVRGGTTERIGCGRDDQEDKEEEQGLCHDSVEKE